MKVFKVTLVTWYDNEGHDDTASGDDVLLVVAEDMDAAITAAKDNTLGATLTWDDDDGSSRSTSVTKVECDECVIELRDIDIVAK